MARFRIVDASIVSLAVVRKGANRRVWALKKSAADTIEHVAPILKSGDDWRVAHIVVAEPGAVEDGGLGTDDVQDVWDPEAIRKAAHSFARAGFLSTAGHFIDERYGHVVESWIAPADVSLGDELVKAGAWVVGFEPTSEGRAAIDAGELTGVSVEGTGVREPVEPVAKQGDAPVSVNAMLRPPKLKVYRKLRRRGVEHEQALVLARRAKVAKAALTTADRAKLPAAAFALPKRRAYPIHTRGHARAALARVRQHGSKNERQRVCAAVRRRYPSMEVAPIEKAALVAIEKAVEPATGFRYRHGWIPLPGTVAARAGVTVRSRRAPETSINVSSPYSDEFRAGVKQIGGWWDGASKSWTVPGSHGEHLDALLERTFGGRGDSPVPRPRPAVSRQVLSMRTR